MPKAWLLRYVKQWVNISAGAAVPCLALTKLPRPDPVSADMKTTIFRLTLVVFAVALAAFLLLQPFGYASAGGESTTSLTPEARHMTDSQPTSHFMTSYSSATSS